MACRYPRMARDYTPVPVLPQGNYDVYDSQPPPAPTDQLALLVAYSTTTHLLPPSPDLSAPPSQFRGSARSWTYAPLHAVAFNPYIQGWAPAIDRDNDPSPGLVRPNVWYPGPPLRRREKHRERDHRQEEKKPRRDFVYVSPRDYGAEDHKTDAGSRTPPRMNPPHAKVFRPELIVDSPPPLLQFDRGLGKMKSYISS